ncbi:hypothetical protein F7725_010667, partial [Dissostichus mawsoni]
MFQYLIIQSVVEQQHVSVPHHSVSDGTTTCFSTSSFSQWWNNNMFQYLIIQSVMEQQHVSVPHHSVSGHNMFQYLIIQSVEQQHVSVPHHSVSGGTTTCFSTSSFSQWNNNMFQYLIIQSVVEQQHVSVPYHSFSGGTTTCFSTSSFSQWNNNMFQYSHSVSDGTTTCFSTSSFSQWNNNMFQYLIIQSVVEQQHVSVPYHSFSGGTTTCFSTSSFSQWNNNMFHQWWNNNMFQYLIIQSVVEQHMFQYLIIQSVVEQQHVSVPHHSVSGTTTCFSTSSFSQWNNNMFQYLIIQSVEQQHVSVPCSRSKVQRSPAAESLTCDGDGEQTALRGAVKRKSRDVINTAVASLMGGLCSREQEVGRELKIVDVSNADGEHLDAQSPEMIGGLLNVVLRFPGLEAIHVENFGGVVPGHDLQLFLVGSFNSDTEDADPVFPQSHRRRYQTVAICGIPVRDHHEDLRYVEVPPAAIVFVEE